MDYPVHNRKMTIKIYKKSLAAVRKECPYLTDDEFEVFIRNKIEEYIPKGLIPKNPNRQVVTKWSRIINTYLQRDLSFFCRLHKDDEYHYF